MLGEFNPKELETAKIEFLLDLSSKADGEIITLIENNPADVDTKKLRDGNYNSALVKTEIIKKSEEYTSIFDSEVIINDLKSVYNLTKEITGGTLDDESSSKILNSLKAIVELNAIDNNLPDNNQFISDAFTYLKENSTESFLEENIKPLNEFLKSFNESINPDDKEKFDLTLEVPKTNVTGPNGEDMGPLKTGYGLDYSQCKIIIERDSPIFNHDNYYFFDSCNFESSKIVRNKNEFAGVAKITNSTFHDLSYDKEFSFYEASITKSKFIQGEDEFSAIGCSFESCFFSKQKISDKDNIFNKIKNSSFCDCAFSYGYDGGNFDCFVFNNVIFINSVFEIEDGLENTDVYEHERISCENTSHVKGDLSSFLEFVLENFKSIDLKNGIFINTKPTDSLDSEKYLNKDQAVFNTTDLKNRILADDFDPLSDFGKIALITARYIAQNPEYSLEGGRESTDYDLTTTDDPKKTDKVKDIMQSKEKDYEDIAQRERNKETFQNIEFFRAIDTAFETKQIRLSSKEFNGIKTTNSNEDITDERPSKIRKTSSYEEKSESTSLFLQGLSVVLSHHYDYSGMLSQSARVGSGEGENQPYDFDRIDLYSGKPKVRFSSNVFFQDLNARTNENSEELWAEKEGKYNDHHINEPKAIQL